MNKLFINYLSCVVASEGLPERTQEAIKLEYQDLAYAGTNSKSVLGSMNDLAFHYKHHIWVKVVSIAQWFQKLFVN